MMANNDKFYDVFFFLCFFFFFFFQNVCMTIFHVIETNSYYAAFFFSLEKNTEKWVCVVFI